MAQWLALLPHNARDLGSIPVCAEYARSPRVCVGLLRVLRFPPTSPKDVLVRCSGHAKFSLSVHKQALECDD